MAEINDLTLSAPTLCAMHLSWLLQTAYLDLPLIIFMMEDKRIKGGKVH